AAALEGAKEAAEALRGALDAARREPEADFTQPGQVLAAEPAATPEEVLAQDAAQPADAAPAQDAVATPDTVATPDPVVAEPLATMDAESTLDDVIVADDLAELFQEASQPDIPIDVAIDVAIDALSEGMPPSPHAAGPPEGDRKARKKRK